jgi:UPF0716 family protein affecting phage T7 exclusion
MMPYVVLLWLLLPCLLDLWLSVMVAEATGVSVWLFFLASAALGIALLVWEWRRVRTYWQALRRLEGSPWQLLASARRGLAALLLILPGLGSDVLALLLLCLGGRQTSAQCANGNNDSGKAARTAYRTSHGVIEGEFRRED